MSGWARPSRYGISTNTAIGWPFKGRSVSGGRKTAFRDQANKLGSALLERFLVQESENLPCPLRRYEIRHLRRGSLGVVPPVIWSDLTAHFELGGSDEIQTHCCMFRTSCGLFSPSPGAENQCRSKSECTRQNNVRSGRKGPRPAPNPECVEHPACPQSHQWNSDRRHDGNRDRGRDGFVRGRVGRAIDRQRKRAACTGSRAATFQQSESGAGARRRCGAAEAGARPHRSARFNEKCASRSYQPEQDNLGRGFSFQPWHQHWGSGLGRSEEHTSELQSL